MSELEPGVVTQTQFHSEILERDITLSIYLPKNYSPLFKYKLVFCFDGLDFFRFGQIHRVYERLRENEQVERAIFIGFHYETVDKRREEFSPNGSRAPLTVKAMGQELLPYIDKTFPTFKVASGRVLLGDSLAGSIALMTALSYPRLFNQVGMFSPMFNEVVDVLANRCQFIDQLDIWQAVGKEEIDFALPTTGERADFLTPNRELKELLEKFNVTHYYEEFDGGHRWKYWRKLMEPLLLYFLAE
ncbi:esterase family protein [Staphylococcus simulans]|uniref:esterase family protein n=1 Tax=Staphylococcus simulans TaxID=1286 RepID=UPI000D1E7650|nr:alpha/beta hydrolase-fold protein [Staphylococcus simulans]MDY5059191.1 alpha/beta hydrolase-fold protein [Staphylococcus simulans]PTJ12727.1 acetylesterase [Staphylococcus simulans]